MKKKLLFIFMLVSFTGVIFLFSGFFIKVPKDVAVNGIEVGGMSYSDAAKKVRDKIVEGINTRPLTIVGRTEYKFSYPDIYFTDNIKSVLKKAKRGREYEAQICYKFKDIEEITARICADEEVSAREPYAIFHSFGAPFKYVDGVCGKRADRRKLLEDIRDSLSNGLKKVNISYIEIPTFKSMKDVEYDTRLLSSFTTNFDEGNEARAHNIALAAASINGKILERGEEFSFNKTVGARTEKRGYKTAKIIFNGEYTDGVGGGVCQVSTTLFNAAIASGCKIEESHPHSLAVSYVSPSRDAMVSGDYYDLKFSNTTGSRIYIRAYAGGGKITFKFYGRGDGAEYSYGTRILSLIPAPVETCEEGARAGKNGIISEGYLTIKRGGKETCEFIRRDKYKPLSAKIPKTEEQDSEEKESA